LIKISDYSKGEPPFYFTCNFKDINQNLEMLANKLIRNMILDNDLVYMYFNRNINSKASVKIEDHTKNNIDVNVLFDFDKNVSYNSVKKLSFTPDLLSKILDTNDGHNICLTSEFTAEITEWSPIF
jgi:hypothetical protein